MKTRLWQLVSIICLVFCLAGSLEAARYRYQDLGRLGSMTMPPDMDVETLIIAEALNDRGQVAGYSDYYTNRSPYYQDPEPEAYWFTLAWCWTSPGGMQRINFGDYFVMVEYLGMNNKGQIVGQAKDPDGVRQAVVWTEESGLRYLGLGSLPTAFVSGAHGINDSGQVVGYSESPYGQQACLWTPFVPDSTPVGLASLGGDYSEAYAINKAGQIVGFSQREDYILRPCVWNPPDYTPMEVGSNSTCEGRAYGINNLGDIVGREEIAPLSITHPFFYDHKTGLMQDPTPQATSYSAARAVNDQGQVVGSESGRAFIWTTGRGLEYLDNLVAEFESGVALIDAKGINNLGQIIVVGEFDNFFKKSYLFSPLHSLAFIPFLLE
jgi:probable HAF family extracellular repeat protein